MKMRCPLLFGNMEGSRSFEKAEVTIGNFRKQELLKRGMLFSRGGIGRNCLTDRESEAARIFIFLFA